MLHVVARLAAHRNDFTFRLVGDGIDFLRLKQLASDLGLAAPTIEFTGLATDRQVATHLREAEFMVMFSNYENQPVVIIESLACGRPVVATRVGGIPEMISEERGRLVNPGDGKGLEASISFMLDNSRNFRPTELRAYATANFSQTVVSAQIIDFYNSILKKNG